MVVAVFQIWRSFIGEQEPIDMNVAQRRICGGQTPIATGVAEFG